MPRRRNQPEEALQRTVAEYLDRALPEDAVWFHCPNGGARTKAEAGVFKALGVKPGIPDILILWRGSLYCIELKPPRRSLSESQKTMRALLVTAGARYAMARTVEAVETALAVWNVPLRASLRAAA